MAKKTSRGKPRGAKKQGGQKLAHQREQPAKINTDSLPVGSLLQHPDAVHLQNVENLPQEIQSIIVDIQNNRDGLVGDLLPAISERLAQVRETVLRLVQGPHTAGMIAADQPPQPIGSHSTATPSGHAVGTSRPTARAVRGAQMHNAAVSENNPPGTPVTNPPAITPPAEQEPGEHA